MARSLKAATAESPLYQTPMHSEDHSWVGRKLSFRPIRVSHTGVNLAGARPTWPNLLSKAWLLGNWPDRVVEPQAYEPAVGRSQQSGAGDIRLVHAAPWLPLRQPSFPPGCSPNPATHLADGQCSNTHIRMGTY